MTVAIILKNRSITISLQVIDWFWWNLARWSILSLRTQSAKKIGNFKNPRWRPPPFWKIKKLRYHKKAILTTITLTFRWCYCG